MSKKNKVEILALIDRSGSMYSIITEAVGAFNTFIEDQKNLEQDDKVKVTLASFDNNYEVIFDRVPLEEVPALTVDMVQPRGMTALNDSIAELINSAKHPNRKTILLVQTDGMENASKEFSTANVKEIITQKEKDGWDVNFIGAGLDEATVAQMGMERGFAFDKTIAVQASASGMDDMTAYFSATSTAYRSSDDD